MSLLCTRYASSSTSPASLQLHPVVLGDIIQTAVSTRTADTAAAAAALNAVTYT